MLEIPLVGKHSDKVAIVDDEFAWLRQFRWCGISEGSTVYALVSRHGDLRRMHRMILGLEKRDVREVDHINHSGLDNRLENLRIVTDQENKMNCSKQSGTSKFKGVWWNEGKQKWEAGVRKDKKQIYLGCFDSEVEAAKVYDMRAKELFGEFACVNFKEEK